MLAIQPVWSAGATKHKPNTYPQHGYLSVSAILNAEKVQKLRIVLSSAQSKLSPKPAPVPQKPASAPQRPAPPPYTVFMMSAYCTDGITASGIAPRPGVVAAGYQYPFGTPIYLVGYGQVIVEDRGGAIYGNRLDLWMPSCFQAELWGVRYLVGYVGR